MDPADSNTWHQTSSVWGKFMFKHGEMRQDVMASLQSLTSSVTWTLIAVNCPLTSLTHPAHQSLPLQIHLNHQLLFNLLLAHELSVQNPESYFGDLGEFALVSFSVLTLFFSAHSCPQFGDTKRPWGYSPYTKVIDQSQVFLWTFVYQQPSLSGICNTPWKLYLLRDWVTKLRTSLPLTVNKKLVMT